MDNFEISSVDQTHAMRLVLAGLNGDVEAANAALFEAGGRPDGYTRLALAAGGLAVSVMSQTVGVERGKEYLLSDLAAILDGPAADGEV